MIDVLTHTVAEIVTADPRAAAVFERYGIDFCCRGDRPVAEACAETGIGIDELMQEISHAATTGTEQPAGIAEWELDALADYIVATHHRYVRDSIPQILAYLNKVAAVHGAHHPETVRVRDIFTKSADDLLAHMDKEEMMLFPMIRTLAIGRRTKIAMPSGTLEAPISVMNAEHVIAGDEFAEMRDLTNGYALPPDACTTFTLAYRQLEEFERDLHRHIYLENAILFPRALEIGRQ